MRYLLAILRTIIPDFVVPCDLPQARKRSRPIWRALELTARRDECIADRNDAGFQQGEMIHYDR
jgi:hypothetical protein